MHFKSYKIYKRAKAEFRHCQNVAYEQYMQSCFEDLNETAEVDIRLFWKLVKGFQNKQSIIYPEIIHNGNVYNSPDGVANCFDEYFCEVYKPKDSQFFDNAFKVEIESVYKDILKTCRDNNGYLPGGEISEKEISDIDNQEFRKAVGYDNIQN